VLDRINSIKKSNARMEPPKEPTVEAKAEIKQLPKQARTAPFNMTSSGTGFPPNIILNGTEYAPSRVIVGGPGKAMLSGVDTSGEPMKNAGNQAEK
jgi:hypothetical protein